MTANVVQRSRRRPRHDLPELATPAATVLVAFVFSAVYDTYRYPFRINAATTSPTYQDTPAALSAAKYVVLALLGAALLLRAGGGWRALLPASRRQALLLALIAWLGGAVLFHSLAARPSHPFELLAAVVFVLPFAYLVGQPLLVPRSQMRALVPWLQTGVLVLAVANAVVDLIELLLFHFTGRLPALGYAGSLTRFGGIWDDPNSAGTFAALVLVFLAAGRHDLARRTALAVAGCAAFSLLLSWSFSALVVLAVGLVTCCVVQIRQRPRLGLAVLAITALFAAGSVTLAMDASAVPLLGSDLRVKLAGSVRSRQDDLARGGYLADHPHTPLEWLAGRDRPGANEAAPMQWLNATGLVGGALLLLWIGWSTAVLRRASYWPRTLAVVLALCTGSVFVPYLDIFPISAFFFVGLAVAGAAATDDRVPTIASKPQPFRDSSRVLGPERTTDLRRANRHRA